MSKAQTNEAAARKTQAPEPEAVAKGGRETGKSYGYQGSTETAEEDSQLEEQKHKVVEAFDDFLDVLVDRADATPGTGATEPATGGTGATGTTTTATPTTGGTTGATSGGYGAGGRPSAGSGRPSGGSGTERATEAAEAHARTLFGQQEAFRVDRARESGRKSHPEASVASSNGHGPAPSAAIGLDKHTPDSNRAPITKEKEFSPAFGSGGKSTAPTIERLAVPPSQRPETAPLPGTVAAGPPIDAYWGSFGTAVERAVVRAKISYAALETVIGTDERVRVTNNELYPWRCIASLMITAASGTVYIGTGWLVSPRVLLTAGHCVYMSDEGGWVTQIEVIPGRDADKRPFQSVVAQEFRSVTGWTQDHDSDYDYGAILLPTERRYGDELGWFGYANRDDDYLRGVTLNLAGYPGDGGPAGIDGTQWYDSRTVKEVQEKQITYEIDTYGGQSGAPVWEMTAESNRYGVAVHTWGTSVSNGGTRITSEVFDNIVAWAGQAP